MRVELTRRMRWIAIGAMIAIAAPFCAGQALPTASGPGTHIDVGAAYSYFQTDYGQNHLGGLTAYGDVNLTWRYGIEAEANYLRYHQQEDVTETTYLVGPKIALRPGNLRPYVKVLVGNGTLNFPFNFAVGNYFVIAPGAGVDLLLGKFTVRALDFEYQDWPLFTSFVNGPTTPLHPYGISAGISYRVYSTGWRRR